jgi:hypothetical protein
MSLKSKPKKRWLVLLKIWFFARNSWLLTPSILIPIALFHVSQLEAAETIPSSPLAGSWRIDLAHSTELSPWKDYTLTLVIAGDNITIRRSLAWGVREFTESMAVHVGQTVNVPVEMWPDNRHLGAYISGDHAKRVHAEWIGGQRLLRLSSDLVLETQQGSRAVNILSDYKLDSSGNLLTLTELRSTRDRPILYVFNRVPSAQ